MNRHDTRLVDRKVQEFSKRFEITEPKVIKEKWSFKVKPWMKVAINCTSLGLSYILSPIWCPIAYMFITTNSIWKDWNEGASDVFKKGKRFWWEGM